MKRVLKEEIGRIKTLMNINEEVGGKISILLDGTSSAGKSFTSSILNAVPYHEATDPNQWVIIGSDDFGYTGHEFEQRRLKLDPPSIRDWAKGEEYGIVSGLYRKDGKDIPPNPRENEYIEDTDARVWYMAEEYKTGPWKKVIFDDIGNTILKYIPNVKHNILLHAPIPTLLQNVGERNKKDDEDEQRKPTDVLDQYLSKYISTQDVPDDSIGDPNTILTRNSLGKLLMKYVSDKDYIRKFIEELGIFDSGNYYIKIKDEYMSKGVQLINVDKERVTSIESFNKILNL